MKFRFCFLYKSLWKIIKRIVSLPQKMSPSTKTTAAATCPKYLVAPLRSRKAPHSSIVGWCGGWSGKPNTAGRKSPSFLEKCQENMVDFIPFSYVTLPEWRQTIHQPGFHWKLGWTNKQNPILWNGRLMTGFSWLHTSISFLSRKKRSLEKILWLFPSFHHTKQQKRSITGFPRCLASTGSLPDVHIIPSRIFSVLMAIFFLRRHHLNILMDEKQYPGWICTLFGTFVFMRQYI